MALSDWPAQLPSGAAGSVTAPASGAVFVSMAAPTTGAYKLVFCYWLSGTTETALANVKIGLNGNNSFISGYPSITGSAPVYITFERVDLDGTNVVALRSVGATTAGAQYNGFITAQRLG